MSIQEIDMKVQELRELQALVEESTTQIEAIKESTPRHTVKKRRTLSFGYLSTQSYPHPSKFAKREKAKKTVSGMLGHFSAGFTLDTYAHVTTAAQMEAAQTIACVLSL